MRRTNVSRPSLFAAMLRVGHCCRNRVAKAVFLGWLLGSSVVGLPAPPKPDAKLWLGSGDGLHWSDPMNWHGLVRSGPPQNGDDVVFGLDFDASTSTVNDLTGLSIQRLDFSAHHDDLFSTQWFLDGNDLTVTGGIGGGGGVADTDIHINCGITLGGSVIIKSSRPGDELTTFRFNGPIDLNG